MQHRSEPSFSQRDQVSQRGEWRVAIASDLLPASGDIDVSLDLVLAKQFADARHLTLKILPYQQLTEARELLVRGQIDAILAVPAASSQLAGLQQTRAYQEVDYRLVFKNGVHRGRSWAELDGDLKVPASSRASELLLEAKVEQPALNWTESPLSHRELMAEIIDETLAYTLVPAPVYAIERSLHPELAAGLVVSKAEPWVWAFPGDDDSLAELADSFLGERIDDGTIASLRDRLVEPIDGADYIESRHFVDAMLERLPALKPHFVHAAKTDLDWRLLAAIAYQESHWRENAISPTGVRGIMMLTEDTAERMGVTDRTDAEQSIRGGAAYFRTMHDTIPERIAEPDRTWFTLAAYNIGFGHLEDARVLTERAGGNPDRWDDVQKQLPKLRDPNVYPSLKRGYARGDEPVQFVGNIQRYYTTLRWLGDDLDSTALRRMAGEPARRLSPVAEPEAEPVVAAEPAVTPSSTLLAYDSERRSARQQALPIGVTD
ncbi:membrane-bound lytic murein transglycosylase MltF [Permianibacter sp. IMCC34836]|uniref:membrane-bound lytic murein transglycosylase MltF n=1 Tax=Permianibacter fluminis TaxID=2738515 RepID=UPI001551E539|nr:membrane-bound lytic murein transglycosylase MltF [Permianibacter fluminis]NQD38646.1 membrane-bound lytic murein transglycosylase MltF [Permianibacter fluminis]